MGGSDTARRDDQENANILKRYLHTKDYSLCVGNLIGIHEAEILSNMDCGSLPQMRGREILDAYEDDRMGMVFVAKITGDSDEFNGIAGYVYFRFQMSDSSRMWSKVCGISIERIVVDKAYRRLGIGTALFEFSRMRLNSRRRYITANCREDDLQALMFFKSQSKGRCRLIRDNSGVDSVGWIFER